MALTRSAPPLELSRPSLGEADQADDSLGKLTARLAHESVELAAIELKRIDVEVKQKGRELARAAGALLVGAGLALIAVATLAGGLVLYLGRVWSDYAAASLATGGLLLLMTAAACAMLLVAVRRLRGPSQQAEERSPGHGT